jgi:hypothetical protein
MIECKYQWISNHKQKFGSENNIIWLVPVIITVIRNNKVQGLYGSGLLKGNCEELTGDDKVS